MYVYYKIDNPAKMTASAPQHPPPENLDEAKARIRSLEQEVQQLRWHVAQLQKRLFGPSSDRAPESISREQILLDLQLPTSPPPATEEVLLPEAINARPAKSRRRRQPVASHLETVTEILQPEETICPHCGEAKCVIGHEKSERYEYVPAKLIRQQILRPKLACPCGQGTVVVAPLPPTLVEKGMAGPGLLAHVVLSKYADHLPLYRQQQMMERLGVSFPRQTLCAWVEQIAWWLLPIVREMKSRLLQGDYLQADETPIRVQDPDVRGRCATGYLWVIGRPGAEVVFEFHPGRGGQYARDLIGTFRGYLQADAYKVYPSMARELPGIQLLGCLAHARRKFVEAFDQQPHDATQSLVQIRALYRIEDYARKEAMTPSQRHDLRHQLAPPILDTLQRQIQALQPSLLPQSPLAKAVHYTLGQWDALTRYLDDGRLEIDNNLIENAIRPSAVGKKNYLFIGHPDAGWRSATIYSITVTCARFGIDPWLYLADVLKRLPSAKQSDIPAFLPAAWKAARLKPADSS